MTLLDADTHHWLEQRVAEVVRVKQQLHRLFLEAGGTQHCAPCDGACCEHGQHHMTLVEALTSLLRNQPLPDPDPQASCPYLTHSGCALSPELRPFNCVTFNCDAVEKHLSEDQRRRFYALEKELREVYAEFEERFAGASLRGLVIRAQRIGEVPLLGPVG